MPLTRRGILTRSGWFPYKAGKEYKCPDALKEAVKLTPSVPIVVGHPEGEQITDASSVVGVAYPAWDQADQAVKARYEFYEDRLANDPNLLSHLKQGRSVGVSPGFSTVLKPYRDGHIQTQVLFNHVALTDVPRCEVPACGVLDSRVDRIGPDEPISPLKSDEIKPFGDLTHNTSIDLGEYIMTPETKTDTEACIKEKMDKGMSKEDAEKACSPKKEDTKTDDVTLDVSNLEDRIAVLEEQLARSDALVTALEPMAVALRKSLMDTKRFTEDELKEKNYAELVWLKSKFDSPTDTPQTVVPPSGLPDSRTLKVPQVGNKRYRYPEKLRSKE